MKTFSKKICFGLVILGVVFPLFAQAQIGSSDASQANFQLVPCDAAPISYTPSGGGAPTSNNPVTNLKTTPCDYYALITTVQRFINLLLYASEFIAVVLIVLAGFKYLTAGGDTGKTKQAKGILKAVVIGMIIAFTSWAIVYYVLVQFTPNGTDVLINPSFAPVNNAGQSTGNGGANIIPLKQQ